MPNLQKSDNGMPTLRTQLTGRITKQTLLDVARRAGTDTAECRRLFGLLTDTDKRVADNAAWAFTHFDTQALKKLLPLRNELTDEVLRTRSITCRRLLLTVLYRLPATEAPRTDLLDFCLHTLLAAGEPNGIRALCIKLAARMCSPIPELGQELRLTLELLNSEPLPPSLRCAQREAYRLVGHAVERADR